MMKGYLMKEQTIVPGSDCFIEVFSPENAFGVVFEDDGDTAYFYAIEKGPAGEQRILDALHIYESGEDAGPAAAGPSSDRDAEPAREERHSRLLIIWSRDWQACALVIDGHCHALFDFRNQGGYNINQFPPPNDFWTKGDRVLRDEKVRELF